MASSNTKRTLDASFKTGLEYVVFNLNMLLNFNETAL